MPTFKYYIFVIYDNPVGTSTAEAFGEQRGTSEHCDSPTHHPVGDSARKRRTLRTAYGRETTQSNRNPARAGRVNSRTTCFPLGTGCFRARRFARDVQHRQRLAKEESTVTKRMASCNADTTVVPKDPLLWPSEL